MLVVIYRFSRTRGIDFGSLTLVAGLVHSILHAARYIYANMAYIMVETDAGRSGLIACFLLLFIVPPMKFEFFKARVRNASERKDTCPVLGRRDETAARCLLFLTITWYVGYNIPRTSR